VGKKVQTWTAPDGRVFALGPFHDGREYWPEYPGTYEVWVRGRDAAGRFTWAEHMAEWPGDPIWGTPVHFWRGLAVDPNGCYGALDLSAHVHHGVEASQTGAMSPALQRTIAAAETLDLDVEGFLKDAIKPDPKTESRLRDWRYWFWTGIVLFVLACVAGAAR